MITTRELCRVLATALHVSGVERYAARLVRRGLLPRAGYEVEAIDAAVLLMAVAAAPRPEDAPHVVATLAGGRVDRNRSTGRRNNGRQTTIQLGYQRPLAAGLR